MRLEDQIKEDIIFIVGMLVGIAFTVATLTFLT